MEPNEFQQDCKIDPTQLDVECVAQPELFTKWAIRAVEARTQVDRLDLQLEVIEARLQAEVRRKPEKFGLDSDKVTEAGVKAAVTRAPKLIEAKERYLEAKEKAALLEKAGVQAMEIKKRMLESLIELHGQEYFAGPRTPRNLVDAWDRYQRRAGASGTDRQKKLLKKKNKDKTK